MAIGGTCCQKPTKPFYELLVHNQVIMHILISQQPVVYCRVKLQESNSYRQCHECKFCEFEPSNSIVVPDSFPSTITGSRNGLLSIIDYHAQCDIFKGKINLDY